jgi:GT2 family glycosyltransferase
VPRRVSVVSVVDDHPPDLELWFGALFAQEFPSAELEIVLADPFCVRDYPAIVERIRGRHPSRASFVYLPVPGRGRSASYNAALDGASAALILFLGPDYSPGPRLVAAHDEFHAQHHAPTAVGIGAGFLVPPFVSRFSSWLERSGHLVGVPYYEGMDSVPPNFFSVGNSSVKRPFLDSVGTFDERYSFHTFDDFELGLRLRAAGMTSQFVPDACSDHHHRITMRWWSRAVRETGASARQYEHVARMPFEWSPVVERSPWNHRLRAYSRLVRFVVRRRPEDRERYYRRMLDAAFSAGSRGAP